MANAAWAASLLKSRPGRLDVLKVEEWILVHRIKLRRCSLRRQRNRERRLEFIQRKLIPHAEGR